MMFDDKHAADSGVETSAADSSAETSSRKENHSSETSSTRSNSSHASSGKASSDLGRKLYVGGLPFKVTKEEITELFEKVGNVEFATIITDRDTGRSKGFGFVTMSTNEEAKQAVSDIDGMDMDGRKLSVAIAKPKEESSGSRPFRSRDGGGSGYSSRDSSRSSGGYSSHGGSGSSRGGNSGGGSGRGGYSDRGRGRG